MYKRYTVEDTLGTATATVSYGYGNANWGDLLTSYNGTAISYDNVGNPTSYRGNDCTWINGRQLAGFGAWNFTYDADGLRTSRAMGTATVYEYTYVDGVLTKMTVGSNTLRFAYSVDGTPCSVNYNGTEYYYVTNLQGDVTAILDGSGNAVAQYTYDAWGKVLTATVTQGRAVGQYNPLRYRGYVYDTDTGLYYLQSRYYDPEVGRFINADAYLLPNAGPLGCNMFAYCYNNPVNYSDTTGTFPWVIIGIVVACVAIIGVDHALAANQPEGGYAVGSEKPENGDIRGLYAKGSGFELDANGVTMCDLNIGLFDVKYNGDYLSLDVLNLFTGSAVAELDWSGIPEVDFSAVASIYSPAFEATLPLGIFDVTVSGEAHLGAVGVGIELDPDSGKFKITPPLVGVGGSFGIDFDLNI